MTRPVHCPPQRAIFCLNRVFAWLALPLLALVVAGCGVPERPIGQLDNAAAAVAQLYVGSEMARIKNEFALTPQLVGAPQAIAEAYMRRFQPRRAARLPKHARL